MVVSSPWLLLLPPVVGGVIGYFTNDLAIQMLFRPYKAVYVGDRKLPFTPGLIPSNQERLAQRVSDTIMGSLLTPEELQKLAQKLLDTKRTQEAIEWLLTLAIDQLQGVNESKATRILADILRDLFGDSLPRLIQTMAQRDDFMETQFRQVFDRVLLNFQLTEEQATYLANWLLTAVLPPDVVRQTLVDLLTDRNIQVIDNGFREKATGTYWVVANFIGLRSTLESLRNYCLDEKEVSNQQIKVLIQDLGVPLRLQEWFQNFSLQNLPISTVQQLQQAMRDGLRDYLREKGRELLQDLSGSVNWDRIAQLLFDRLRYSEVVTSSLGPVSQELALVLERYLEQDMERLVAEIIPILNIDQVIINRVQATSPQNLEAGIQGIVKSELQAIVNLGGFLGFTIGLLQAALLFFQG
ncbi:MAG: DUF445 family protein [Leptolyngbyaceae bacterium]|nr:DUF445 family protein [Leptolyngbyaceae bacterium]